MGVVFFGSGPVAAESLALLAKNFDIEAVVTKPRPAHHKAAFPVITVAKDLGIPTHFVSNKKQLSELFATKPFKSQLAVLIDFGIIVSQDVIDYFSLGIVNSHFSLLPEWRGADPITFSVLSGQKQTGVSLMLLVEGMDEGPLLGQVPYDLPDDITTPELTKTLIEISDKALSTILPLWIDHQTLAMPQVEVTMAPSKVPTYSRKLSKADGIIDWDKPAKQIEREIRAYLGWPGSRTNIGSKDVIITKAHAVPSQPANAKPGSVEVIKDIGLIMITTGNGSLCIEKLKPAGKREMTTQEFLRGVRL